ncbi:MAG TPA: hypothetical protein VIJ95_18455 [Hanamia sp.]
MKKIIFLCLAALFSTGIFASPLRDPVTSAKILKLFQQDFPEVTHPVINKVGDYYMVYFRNEEDNSSSRISYDSDGNLLETIKYYTSEQLAPFIRIKISNVYKEENITNVTEVTNALNHYYQIILKDSKSMYVVVADVNGNVLSEKKYNRG